MPSVFDGIETDGVFKALTKAEVKTRMQKLVPQAFRTLEANLYAIDEKVQVQAALGILDRCGYGPHSKVTVEESTEDLSNLTTEELKVRALRIAQQLTEPMEEPSDNPAFEDKSVH
jgi:hypothetical protein